MKKCIRIFLSSLLLISACVLGTGRVFAGDTGAQVWNVGDVGTATTLFCKKQDEVEAILKTTMTKGYDAGYADYQILAGSGECIYARMAVTIVGGIETFKNVEFPTEGSKQDIYVVEVAGPKGEKPDVFMASWWPIVPKGEPI